MSEPFVGEIRQFTYSFAPRGWAYCDGQLLPIASNTALFSILGTTYGGDGRSTFAVPDLKGRVPMGQGRGPGLTDRRLGQKVGVETVTLTTSQIPSHTHQLFGSNNAGDTDVPTNMYAGRVGLKKLYAAESVNKIKMDPNALKNAGGNQPHENRQPFLSISFCIALVGLYPSRN